MPKKDVVRIHCSSGTTGQATVVGYTKQDIANWGRLMGRCFTAIGASADDVIHNAYGYGLFTGGLGVHYGAEEISATVVPMSGGSTERQCTLLKDFGATVLCATPSYALYLHEAAAKIDIDFSKLPLRVGIFGAEPWTEAMRENLEKKLAIKAYDIYGLSEIMGPGVGCECTEQKGLHIQEDHFLIEIIDPVTCENLPDGELGELVITTLTKEAIPLIRYRTKDLTRINRTQCACGRTTARIDRLTGRSDDMLIIRGVNVFPSQIEEILVNTEGTTPHYQLILKKQGALDTLEIRIELAPTIAADEIKHLQNIERNIQKQIKEYLGVSAKCTLLEANSIERSTGKATRVIDLRNE